MVVWGRIPANWSLSRPDPIWRAVSKPLFRPEHLCLRGQIVANTAMIRTRDKIWTWALTRTVLKGDAITQEEGVDRTGASERTVRETLTAMSESPFLERKQELDGSVRYVRGPAFED